MDPTTPRKLSPLFFGFALFCFLLPFVTVSCPGGQASLTGVQLVTGTEIQGEKLSGEPLAGLAFLAALVGLAATFLKTREGFAGAAVAGGAGVVLLLLLQSKLSSEAMEETGGLATLTYEIGFWLALVALAGGAAFSLYLRSRTEAPGKTERPAPTGDAQTAR